MQASLTSKFFTLSQTKPYRAAKKELPPWNYQHDGVHHRGKGRIWQWTYRQLSSPRHLRRRHVRQESQSPMRLSICTLRSTWRLVVRWRFWFFCSMKHSSWLSNQLSLPSRYWTMLWGYRVRHFWLRIGMMIWPGVPRQLRHLACLQERRRSLVLIGRWRRSTNLRIAGTNSSGYLTNRSFWETRFQLYHTCFLSAVWQAKPCQKGPKGGLRTHLAALDAAVSATAVAPASCRKTLAAIVVRYIEGFIFTRISLSITGGGQVGYMRGINKQRARARLQTVVACRKLRLL